LAAAKRARHADNHANRERGLRRGKEVRAAATSQGATAPASPKDLRSDRRCGRGDPTAGATRVARSQGLERCSLASQRAIGAVASLLAGRQRRLLVVRCIGQHDGPVRRANDDRPHGGRLGCRLTDGQRQAESNRKRLDRRGGQQQDFAKNAANSLHLKETYGRRSARDNGACATHGSIPRVEFALRVECPWMCARSGQRKPLSNAPGLAPRSSRESIFCISRAQRAASNSARTASSAPGKKRLERRDRRRGPTQSLNISPAEAPERMLFVKDCSLSGITGCNLRRARSCASLSRGWAKT
jgi:hypothetical protein